MVITSFSFLLYFLPIMLVGYFLLSSFKKARNIWLVLCGLAFYFLNGIECLILLVAIALLNYIMGFAMNQIANKVSNPNLKAVRAGKEKVHKSVRGIMALSVFINITPIIILVVLPQLFGNPPYGIEYSLMSSFMAPFAIAFLTLQGISYTADIYRGNVKWDSNILNTLVYFTMFFVVFAGPIIKYHEMAPQIEDRKSTFDKTASGIGRLVIGLAKLCIIAEPLLAISKMVTDTSNMSGVYSSAPISLMLVGLACCVIGMFHFLSGFNDVAVGIGRMLGFTLPENFRHPHLALTVTAFWQRCYCTLTDWFDEYVYSALSKRRSNNDRMVLHMLLIWLLIGLWIGPTIPHLIFGFWNFAFLLFEKIVEMREKTKVPGLRSLYVMIVAVISVIALNSSGMYQFTLYISNLVGMKGYGFESGLALVLLQEYWPLLLVGLIASFPIATKIKQLAESKKGFHSTAYSILYPIAMVILVVLIVLRLSGVSFDPTQIFNTFMWRGQA